jgi:hypothetical protein
MKLYELSNEVLFLLDALSVDGELSPEAEERLDALHTALEDKADAIACVVRELEADAAGYAVEAKRFGALAAATTRQAERLKAYLKTTLERLGIVKLKTPRFVLSVQKNATPCVRLADGAAVPAGYERTRIELDGAKILADYHAGRPLPADVTVEHGTHLRMR